MRRRPRTWVFVLTSVVALAAAATATRMNVGTRRVIAALELRMDSLERALRIARTDSTRSPTASGLAGPRRIRFDEQEYDAFVVDLREVKLASYWKDDSGRVLGSIAALRAHVERHGQRLLFATNAGMFTKQRAPLGLYVEDGHQVVGLNLRRGASGNFYLAPNGVFFITAGGAGILESAELRRRGLRGVRFATQSGPLLVHAGRIHLAFSPSSSNRTVRSGVGILAPHLVVFAISREPVTFWEFARFFRDMMHSDDALFLDGTISLMYAPEIRSDSAGDFGALLAATAPY